MGLPRQIIDLNLAVGVEENIDEKILPPGVNAVLENGYFTKDGRIDKISDFFASTNAVATATLISSGFIHGGRSYVESSGGGDFSPAYISARIPGGESASFSTLYGRTSDGQFSLGGRVRAITVASGGDDSPSYVTSAQAGGYLLTGFGTATELSFVVSIVATGQIVFSDNITTPNAKACSIRASGSERVGFVYEDAATLKFLYFNALTNLMAAATVVAASNTASMWDVADRGDSGTTLDVYYHQSVANEIYHVGFTRSGTVTEAAASIIAEQPKLVLSVNNAIDSMDLQVVTWQSNTSSRPRIAQVSVVTIATVTVAAADISTTTTNIVRISAVPHPGGLVASFVEYAAAGGVPRFISVSTGQDIFSASLVAKPFMFDSTTVVAPVAITESGQQCVLYLGLSIDVPPLSAGCWAPLGIATWPRGPSVRAVNYLTTSTPGNDDDFIIGSSYQVRLESDGALVEIPIALSFQIMSQPKVTDKVSGITMRSGATIGAFDGLHMLPSGPLLPPTAVTLTASGAAGVAAGTYLYRCIIEWEDSFGNVCRSQPSAPVGITLPGSRNVAVAAYIVGLPLQKFTTTTLFSSAAKMVVYRTTAGSDTYYRTGETTVSVTTLIATFTDTNLDAAIADNQILYATGGVFENIPPPPCEALAIMDDRAWAIPSDRSPELWVSKPKALGVGIEFSEELTKPITVSGRVIGIVPLDGRLVILATEGIYWTPPQAPSATGVGIFGQVYEISTEFGCAVANGFCRIPDGIVFYSRGGLYLLDRSLQIQFIGGSVRDTFDSYLPSKMVYREDRDELWILCRETASTQRGVILIYNRRFGRWSKTTRQSSNKVRDLLIDNDGVVSITLYGTSILTTDTMTTANSNNPSANFTGTVLRDVTPWLKFSSYQEIKRLCRATLLGEWRSACSIVLKTYTNYNDTTAVSTQTFSLASGYSVGDPVRVRFHMSAQKAQAWKFELYDANLAGTGEGIRPSTLSLEFAVSKPRVKLPSSISL